MSPKQAQLSSMSLMVFIMTFVIVFISTWINFGFGEDFLFRFLRGWGVAFVLALPLVMVLMPNLHKFFQSKVKM